MWLVTESPEFAQRALGAEFCGELSNLPIQLESLPFELSELVLDLAPGRALFGRNLSPSENPTGGHILALLSPARSQFDAAIELVREHGGHDIFCIAGAGTAMRGHHGRSWSASLGNLHLTAIFALQKPGLRATPALTALPSVAVCDVLNSETSLENYGIKWVNDVLLDGAKVAGVLAHTSSRGEELSAYVCGVGLNVEVTPKIAEDPAVPAAICVVDRQSDLKLAAMSLPLMLALKKRTQQWTVEGDEPVVDAYRSGSLILGERVEVLRDPRPESASGVSLSRVVVRRGRVLRLDEHLQLHLDDGDPTPVRSGRLRLLDEQWS